MTTAFRGLHHELRHPDVMKHHIDKLYTAKNKEQLRKQIP